MSEDRISPLKRPVEQDSVNQLAKVESKLLDLQAFTVGSISEATSFQMTCNYMDPLLSYELQNLRTENKYALNRLGN